MMVGDTVRITAQLIDTGTEKHLWADSYQRDLSDILSLQSEVASEVSSAIEVSLTPEEATLLARDRTVDPEAHRLYLRGRYAMERFHPEEARKAIDLFHQAIALDPTSALPYAGLAEAYTQLKSFSAPPHEVMPKAKAAALRALELDPHLSLWSSFPESRSPSASPTRPGRFLTTSSHWAKTSTSVPTRCLPPTPCSVTPRRLWTGSPRESRTEPTAFPGLAPIRSSTPYAASLAFRS